MNFNLTVKFKNYSWKKSCKNTTQNSLERFPSAPIIRDGFPKNVTAIVNTTLAFECPLISDLGAHVQWTKVNASSQVSNSSFTNNVSKLEVSVTRTHASTQLYLFSHCRWWRNYFRNKFVSSLFLSLVYRWYFFSCGVEFPMIFSFSFLSVVVFLYFIFEF